MSIRFPLQTVGTFTNANELGAGSALGGVAFPFKITQDTDNVVVKLQASVRGAGVSALFQTTDDGGVTWYDVARTSIVSNTGASILGGSHINAEWLSIPVVGSGFRSAVQGQNSVAGATNTEVALNSIGRAAASSLGQSQVSGLPLLSQQARVFIVITGDVVSAASNLVTTKVMVNSQSATA
jgi:hypothetical protein